MKLKSVLSTTVMALGLTCLSTTGRADFISERLHLERELDRICTVSIGAPHHSDAYIECRNFYDRKFYDYGLDWDYLTPAEIEAFLSRTNPFIMRCRNQGLVSALLWGCIRDFEDRHYHDWHKHHPDFKPKHEYRPHFEKNSDRPAPHADVPPPRPDVKPEPIHHKAAPKAPEMPPEPVVKKKPIKIDRHRRPNPKPYPQERVKPQYDIQPEPQRKPTEKPLAPPEMKQPDAQRPDNQPVRQEHQKH